MLKHTLSTLAAILRKHVEATKVPQAILELQDAIDRAMGAVVRAGERDV